MNLKKILFVLSICLIAFAACNFEKKEETAKKKITNEIEKPLFFKLSLAQWSLNKQIRNGDLNVFDFAQKANELGFEGVEYVSQLYSDELKKFGDPKIAMDSLLHTLKEKSEIYQVQNLLIMVDNEGDLATPNENERNLAVENHKKWVDAAQFLGCHSIRVNLFGTNDPIEWKKTAADGLTKLSNYAKEKNINVLVENHGYLSSNASLLVELIKNLNLTNCGLLPDFGNFCLKRKKGERWSANCIEEYDKYKGVQEMMPYSFAVSAKSYDFDEKGNETTIDYLKMIKIVKNANYKGFIGVEYEGNRLSEIEGIIATKKLLIKAAKELH